MPSGRVRSLSARSFKVLHVKGLYGEQAEKCLVVGDLPTSMSICQ